METGSTSVVLSGLQDAARMAKASVGKSL
jgi:hypothetical protein